MLGGSEREMTELAARLAHQDPRVKLDADPAAQGLAAAWQRLALEAYGMTALPRARNGGAAPNLLLLGSGQAIQPLVEQLSLARRERAGRLG